MRTIGVWLEMVMHKIRNCVGSEDLLVTLPLLYSWRSTGPILGVHPVRPKAK